MNVEWPGNLGERYRVVAPGDSYSYLNSTFSSSRFLSFLPFFFTKVLYPSLDTTNYIHLQNVFSRRQAQQWL